jgi:hypothetical protein
MPSRTNVDLVRFRWSDGYNNAVEFASNRDTFVDNAVNAAIDLRNKTVQHFHDQRLGRCRYYRPFALHHHVSNTWIEIAYLLSKKEPERQLASAVLPSRFVCTNLERERSEKDDLEMILELSADVRAMVEANEEWVATLVSMVDKTLRHP